MACYNPLKGYRSRTSQGIVFSPKLGYIDLPVTIPCGQCIGCRLEKSRQWAIRCSHESSLYSKNSFITLTYNDSSLPSDGSLNLKHFQNFIKRLRKLHQYKTIRYYHCGEYGPKLGRPHYHACLFNHDFEDKTLWQIKNDVKLYVSKELQTLWPYGYSTTGDVTFQSAAYVARYIMKKITGPAAEAHYEHTDAETGEITSLAPEYTTMSLKPGIGSGWLEKFKSDVYPDDFVLMNGKKMRPPRYYNGLYELTDARNFVLLQRDRKKQARKHKENNTPARLRVREICQEQRLKHLPRKYEDQQE